MSRLNEITESLKKDIQKDIKKAGRFFKHLSILNTLLIIFLIVGTWKVSEIIKYQKTTLNKQEANFDLLMRNIQVINEPAILLKIIQEKAPKLPAETQCKIADAWFRICSSRNIPVWVACGVNEVESGFNPAIKNSSSGAVGWFQVMTSSARPYMNFTLGGYSKEKLEDPLINSICGLNILADYRDSALELGMNETKAMELGLGHYNCGNIILNNGYSTKVLTASIKYKERFELPFKELHKDNIK